MTPVSFIIIVKVINAGADTLLSGVFQPHHSDRLNLTEVFAQSSGESFLDFTNSVEWFDNPGTPSGI
jgi:hypothetical protein